MIYEGWVLAFIQMHVEVVTAIEELIEGSAVLPHNAPITQLVHPGAARMCTQKHAL